MENYILKQWESYNLTDTKADFEKLLLILEAHNENIDSLHHAVLNRHTRFCSINCFASWETDKDLANTLFDFHLVFKNKSDFMIAMIEWSDSESKEELDEFIKYCDVRKVKNAYIWVLEY